MKTKAVYVLTSSPEDFYYEQLFMSVFSLKYHNKDMTTVLVTDELTNQSFGKGRENLKCYFDEIVVESIPGTFTPMQRSRFLKTSLCKYVKGDFLYIDTDTIITGSLHEIDECPQNFGLVLDTTGHKRPFSYYNSGVIYAKDTPITKEFYESWHQGWLRGVDKGVNLDQPSLYETTNQYSDFIKTLSINWNCNIKGVKAKLEEAKIIHYYTTIHFYKSLVELQSVLETIREMDNIPNWLKRKIVHHPTECFNEEYIIGANHFHIQWFNSNISFLLNQYPSSFKFINVLARIILFFIAIKNTVIKNNKRNMGHLQNSVFEDRIRN